MIREDKTRIMITLPKKQAIALRRCAARQHIPVSKLISQILSKKAETLLINKDLYKILPPKELLQIAVADFEMQSLSLEDKIRIAKTKWLDD